MTTTVTYPVLTEEQFASMDKPVKMQYTQSNEYGGQMNYMDTRHPLSSVILSEEMLCELPPEHTIRYIEVPVMEEVVKTVPVKSVVEIEKIVPRYEVEYVEKIVEVPQVHYIDRHVEKEHIQEVIEEVPGETEIREINRTVVRKIPKVEYVDIEKTVEVPGYTIDVTKHPVDTIPHVKRYHDVEVPVVVAQTIQPVITQTDEYVDVDVFEYEPQITPVDVYVATPITSKLIAVGAEQDVHNCVSIPPSQYNTILKSLNTHIPEKEAEKQLPFIKTNGTVGFLSSAEAPGYIPLESLDQVTRSKTTDIQHYTDLQGEPITYNDRESLHGMDTTDVTQQAFPVKQQDPKKPLSTPQDKKKRGCGC